MTFSPQKFLQDIVGTDLIRVVDVGARNGFHAMAKLHQHMELLLVEPDLQAAEELKRICEKMNLAGYTIVDRAIGNSKGEALLNITKRASMSSLLLPDFDGFRRHMSRVKFGADWIKFLEVTATQRVELCSLPDLLNEKEWNKADFLKLDTQGTESGILKSCESLLKLGTFGVIEVEVSFFPIYKGQAYFSDIDQLMRRCGYHLVELRTYPEFVQKLHAVNFGTDVYEPVKHNTVGDACYVRDSFGEDRKQALRSAVILAALGLYSEADYIIGNNLSHADKSSLFRFLSDVKPWVKIKSALKRLLPPALLYAWFRMKSKA